VVLGGALLALIPAAPVAAETRICRGEIGARTVDNVKVPDGATCVLRGTTVKGTVTVEENATLRAIGVRVVGNIQGEDSRRVVVRDGSRVGGSVQVVQSGIVKVLGSRVDGDVLIDENDRQNVVRQTMVGGNIQAFQNTGGVVIAGNRVDGDLQCKENRPAPTGGGNIVDGSKEDQCRRL
jgi:hypothetical protein